MRIIPPPQTHTPVLVRKGFQLERAYELKPLVDGKVAMTVLGVKGGPQLGMTNVFEREYFGVFLRNLRNVKNFQVFFTHAMSFRLEKSLYDLHEFRNEE